MAVFLVVAIVAVGILYGSLVFTARPLSATQYAELDAAITVLERKGFVYEAFKLRNGVVFRSDDHWLNALSPKENAYAATNYPFAIITLYADFFTYPADSTERAAILLHEAMHLDGFSEKEAYDVVWRNRKYLGWTEKAYPESEVLMNIRTQTREYAPHLFVCEFRPYSDCTE